MTEPKPAQPLPPRQQEVFALSQQGLWPVQIAERLGISQPAVRMALTSARRKLGIEAPPAGVSSSTRYGRGRGLFGEANGTGNGNGKQDWNENTNQQGHNGQTPIAQNKAAQRRVRMDELREKALVLISDAIDHADRWTDRIGAATYALNKIDGSPKQSQEIRISADPNQLSDEELAVLIINSKAVAELE